MEFEIPDIALEEVASSQIHSIGFDATSGTMAIRFKKHGQPDSLYHYRGVSQQQFDEFRNAESIGSHFYRVFKPDPKQFPYTRVVE